MPTLICDLRSNAAELADAYRSLREAGEPVVLFWPQASPAPDMVVVADSRALEAALDDERMVCLVAQASLPAWFPAADCHRVLLVTELGTRIQLAVPETALLRALFAAGAEEVELLSAQTATDLSQSWRSGRRTGALRITDY